MNLVRRHAMVMDRGRFGSAASLETGWRMPLSAWTPATGPNRQRLHRAGGPKSAPRREAKALL
ncbi:hypothetical protein [Phenylobacterium sp.]|uniref:hypothetical protein n=1 Tax=Phenylobacterium sp. TaxID=1871053 RepID=UPI002F3E3214